jgi:tetratricopeptide (TPR) repeat protein
MVLFCFVMMLAFSWPLTANLLVVLFQASQDGGPDPESQYELAEAASKAFDNVRFKEAYGLFTKALAIAADRELQTDLFIRRALCAWELGRPDKGIADCDRALALEPDNRQAVLYRANILLEGGDFEEAAVAYYNALHHDFNGGELACFWVFCYLFISRCYTTTHLKKTLKAHALKRPCIER